MRRVKKAERMPCAQIVDWIKLNYRKWFFYESVYFAHANGLSNYRESLEIKGMLVRHFVFYVDRRILKKKEPFYGFRFKWCVWIDFSPETQGLNLHQRNVNNCDANTNENNKKPFKSRNLRI